MPSLLVSDTNLILQTFSAVLEKDCLKSRIGQKPQLTDNSDYTGM